jgi:hypothetical protein
MGLYFFTNEAVAQTAPDRCQTRHCTCKVRPGPAPKAKIKSVDVKRSHSIFFGEDDASIESSQAYELNSFIKKYQDAGTVSITLVGYTDGCGSITYNKALASKRVTSIKAKIRSEISAKVSTKIIGEKTSGHSPDARRVDIIVHTKKSLTTRIEKVPADVYLIDASGSMWNGWRDWKDVVNASKKPGSRVYLSIMSGCYNGQKLESVTPQGGTEIWYSYWTVLDYMKPGETLLIISDFQSNIPLTSSEAELIRKKVQQKGVRVKTLHP